MSPPGACSAAASEPIKAHTRDAFLGQILLGDGRTLLDRAVGTHLLRIE